MECKALHSQIEAPTVKLIPEVYHLVKVQTPSAAKEEGTTRTIAKKGDSLPVEEVGLGLTLRSIPITDQ